MVDRIELVFLDQTLQMRKFECYDTFWLQKQANAGHEVVEIGNLRQHVVADDQIRLHAASDKVVCETRAEEIDLCRDALIG